MATNNADNFTNPVSVVTGGTSLSTLTNHSIQIGNGTSAPTQLTVGTTGTLLIGNTGADPSFSATPSITSITFGSGTPLSNYTEGTWTPTLIGGTVAGTTVYSSQNGYYTTIGNLVFLQGNLIVTSSTGTGNATIGGLPFTVKQQTMGNLAESVLINASTWVWVGSRTSMVIRPVVNSTTALLVADQTATAAANQQMSSGAITLTFSILYQM